MKLKIYVIIITIIGSASLMGCSSHTLESMISSAQKQSIDDYLQQLDAYHLEHKYTHAAATRDSLIQVMVNQPEDTIYIVEYCNPPLYTYFAYIWNSHKQFVFYDNGSVYEQPIFERDKPLIPLIEKWDKRQINIYSNSKPLVHNGYWMESVIATRLIFGNGKCINADAILFREIDFDCTAPITIIE